VIEEKSVMRSKLAFVAAGAALLWNAAAGAVTVPFTEAFATDVAGWENAASAPLTFEASGGPDGSGYASTTFNYFGFSNPFGGGPVIFRASDSDDPSGDAFVGNWITAGVETISVWFYHEAPEALTPFLRIASSFNFPGAVFDATTAVAPSTWTQVVFDIDPDSPLCTGETVTCAAALANVGNVQLGTDAPAGLIASNEAYFLGIDDVAINAVPEPGTSLLLAGALVGLGLSGRRRA
jgi:hypothetical protein